MQRIVVESRLDEEGLLHLRLPMGAEQAGRTVRVTIEPQNSNSEIDPIQWRAAILATAGGWQGEFERPE